VLAKKVVLVPIQSFRLFHKFEDMVEFTVVKILRRDLPNILILSVMSYMLICTCGERAGIFLLLLESVHNLASRS